MPPQADTPAAAVRHLVGALVLAGRLAPEAAAGVERKVWERERMGSTAIGSGAAIPHCQTRLTDRLVGVAGRCRRPVPWPGAPDDRPVGVIVLLVAPVGPPGEVLRELGRVAEAYRPRPPA